MENLKGKKLLILGSTPITANIVNKAKELGVYTIITDWNTPEKSPVKKESDEYWEISLSETDKIVELIKEQNIDGVFTNYTDSYLPYYVDICEKAGLPCLANRYQIDQISNKDYSKAMCVRNGISVSKEYHIEKIEDVDNMAITYPVLTKPVDNSGQRGVLVCRNVEELKKCYEESLKFTDRGNVIIEEYVDGLYTVMNFAVQNGHVTLSAMADKPVTDDFIDNQPKLPFGYFLPSDYTSLCEEKVLPNVQKFVDELELKNGVIGIEGVVKDNDIFVFEMQFRLGGMCHNNFVLLENGMDIMAMLIRFALTGKFEGWNTSEYDNPYFKNHYCLLNFLIEADTVGRIDGLDEVLQWPQVYSHVQKLRENDTVKLPGTVQQIAFKFSLVEKTKKDLMQLIEKIYNTVKVYNLKGENIVITPTYLGKMV